jgi:hypothetical protein
LGKREVQEESAMRIVSARIIFTVAIILFLGLLITNKVLFRAHAAASGTPSCKQAASDVKQKSIQSGFSESGATSQAENFLARCLINR